MYQKAGHIFCNEYEQAILHANALTEQKFRQIAHSSTLASLYCSDHLFALSSNVRMSSSKVALGEHIIYEHFGAAVGVVAGILLARGRLSYETLLRLLPRPTFTQATAQAALLVLVQHNCLYYVQDEEGSEYYEMDLDEVLQRRRFGQFMALTREYWSKRGLEVLMRVLAEGKVKLADLLVDCSDLSDERSTIRAIYELLDSGVLRPVKLSDQTSKEDQDLQLEKKLLRDVKGPPGPKDIKRIKEEVMEKRAEMEAAPRAWGKDHEVYVSTCLSDDVNGHHENGFVDTEQAYSGSKVGVKPSPHALRGALLMATYHNRNGESPAVADKGLQNHK